MKYRKKPVVIDAWRFNGQSDLDWPSWIFKYKSPEGLTAFSMDGKLFVPTLEGMMTAAPGDWIIRGIAGEIYPCKDDIFQKTYEAADDNQTRRT